MRFDFGEILSRAWQIIWKFKILWVFGILYSCGRSGAPSSNGSSGSRVSYNPNGSLPYNFQPPHFFNGSAGQVILIAVMVLLLVLLLAALVTAISTMGKIGLVRGAVKAEGGAASMSFGELWQTHYFGRLFLLNFLVGLVGFLIALMILVPVGVGVFSMVATGRAAIMVVIGLLLACLLPLLCLLVPVSWVLGVWLELSKNAMLVEDLGLMPSLKRGWALFRQNLVNTIGMGLVLWILQVVAGFLVTLPLLFTVVPAIFGAVLGGVSQSNGLLFGSLGLALLCLCAYLPVALVANGIVQSYQGVAWALAFLRLTGSAPAEPATPAEPLAPPAEELPPAI